MCYGGVMDVDVYFSPETVLLCLRALKKIKTKLLVINNGKTNLSNVIVLKYVYSSRVKSS